VERLGRHQELARARLSRLVVVPAAGRKLGKLWRVGGE
jgi:hypothetical protein